MNDPERIDRMTEKFHRIWQAYPELPFGQVVINILRQLHNPVSEFLFWHNPDEDWEVCMDTCFQDEESADVSTID